MVLPACFYKGTETIDMDMLTFRTFDDIRQLVSISESDISRLISQATSHLETALQKIIEQPESSSTFASTFGAYDAATASIVRTLLRFESLSLVETKSSLRKALSEAGIRLKNVITDKISTNQPLYKVLKLLR